MTHSAGSRPRGSSPDTRGFTLERVPSFRDNRLLQLVLLVFAVLWTILAFHPVDRRDWLLENALIVAAVAAMAFTYRLYPFTNRSYLLLAVFLLLHAVGAHYAYEHTPIDSWYRETFHVRRGVYDRIVHLTFGLLVFFPVREVLLHRSQLSRFWSYAVPYAIILAMSALFEILEVRVALLAGEKLAQQYLGTQGDPFDSQKDMEMSLLGGALAIVLSVWLARRANRSAP
ncbi:membrane protein [Paenibacillus sp. J31TS4]|uniref:DUF2238 domain-containing protein n=1 Tax=Paenibacillus sp. J31TS4 TaxID=2807195 RepID=UPI001B2949EA|nr:DUF2238 domain-containing protein [Paenibacillus sp. J31TS4]GIP37277.1 membrane protein [Paenibacillus sp. J31TS4]